MKIEYISQYFPPEMGAPAARAAELAHHWTNSGNEVTVLTGFPNHPTGKLHPDYRARFRRLLWTEDFHGARVVRTWLLPFPNRRPYERMLNYSSFCLSAAATGMFVSRPDCVIASSPQLLVGLSGWWVARTKRVPFIFEVRDLWPESLRGVDMAAENSWLYRALARVAGFLYRRAHHIVVVTPAFREHLIEHWNVPPQKISVVENGVETDLFYPQPADPKVKNELNAEGKFVVCYIGTIGLAQGLSTLIATAAELQRSAPHVVFMVIGEGADKERVVNLAREQQLTNIRFIDQQPREKIPAYIAASDACLVLLKKSEIFKTVIPTKMLEFMSCGRPVVLGVDGQARTIVENARAGVFVEAENARALAASILQLSADPAARNEMGRLGREYILRHFTRAATAGKYLRVIDSVLQKGSDLQEGNTTTQPLLKASRQY